MSLYYGASDNRAVIAAALYRLRGGGEVKRFKIEIRREGEGEPLMTVGVGTRSLAKRLLESLADEDTTVRIAAAKGNYQRQVN